MASSPFTVAESTPATPIDMNAALAQQFAAKRAGVYFRGLFYGGSGYAQENLLIALGLAAQGLPVRIDPLEQFQDAQSLLTPETQIALEYLKLQPLDFPNSILLQETPADGFRLDLFARHRVGRTMFETDRIPHDWVDRCNAMDEVWVPSRFNLQTFANSGVRESKLRLMQQGENTALFHPGYDPLPIEHTRGFNFLSIFKWEKRKGPDVLLKAFCREFKPDEDVALILRTYSMRNPEEDLLPFLTHFIESQCKKRLEDIPPIILLSGFLPRDHMPRIYASADCFVLPTRGEGWGRPYTEALASGLPVIATRWSGQMDFLTEENSYLVDYKMAPTGPDVDLEILAGHNWAEPELDHLCELMRHVYSHRDEAAAKGLQGRRDIVQKFDLGVIMQQWSAELRRLLES